MTVSSADSIFASESRLQMLPPFFWVESTCVLRPEVVTVSDATVAIVRIFPKPSTLHIGQVRDNLVLNFHLVDFKFSLAHFFLIVIVVHNVILVIGSHRPNNAFEEISGSIGSIDEHTRRIWVPTFLSIRSRLFCISISSPFGDSKQFWTQAVLFPLHLGALDWLGNRRMTDRFHQLPLA